MTKPIVKAPWRFAQSTSIPSSQRGGARLFNDALNNSAVQITIIGKEKMNGRELYNGDRQKAIIITMPVAYVGRKSALMYHVSSEIVRKMAAIVSMVTPFQPPAR